jgi:prepilin-type N-terminal cleavage/methylation domain-containing protein
MVRKQSSGHDQRLHVGIWNQHPTRRQDTIRRRTLHGFTLIEALVATTIAAIAGTALLEGVYGSIGSTKFAQEQAIANGLAQMLMDEIAGKMYCAVRNQPYETTLGPSAAEQAGLGRSLFNDIDDFNGVRTAPPKDPWNIAIGDDDGRGNTSASNGLRHPSLRVSSFLANWRHEVDVYYVSATNFTTKLSAGQTSDFRCVEVRIYVNDPNGARRNVATLKRVVAYVPSL